MKVFVKLIGHVARGVYDPEFWVSLDEGSTLKDLIEKLIREKGIKFELDKGDVVVLINGRSSDFLGGLGTQLKDMDKIVIMPVVAGG